MTEQNNSNPPPLIGWLLQVSPLIGSVGSFFYSFPLLHQGQPEKLPIIISSVCTLVSVLWAAGYKGFSKKLERKFLTWGEKLADMFGDWVDSLYPQLKLWRQTEKFKNNYLEWLKVDCLWYSNSDEDNRVNLDTVFVPSKLSESAPAAESSRRQSNSNARQLSKVQLLKQWFFALFKPSPEQPVIWKHLAQVRKSNYRCLVILAQGGFGKTTLLKHIALTYAKKQHRKYGAPNLFPVLLSLKEFQGKFNSADRPPILPRLIEEHIVRKLWGSPDQMPANWTQTDLSSYIEKLLRRGKVLVMLDEFDELPDEQRQVIRPWIEEQTQRQDYLKSVFILTSRLRVYEAYKIKSFGELWLTGFEFSQQKDFINCWFGEMEEETSRAESLSEGLISQIARAPRLKEAVESPYLLSRLVQIHRSYPDSRFYTRVELYQRFCELQLERRPFQSLSREVQQELLETLALEIVRGESSAIQQQRAIEVLQSKLTIQEGSIDLKRFLDHMVGSGWLRHISNPLRGNHTQDRYTFSYPSFLGYLAAKQICFLQQDDLLLNRLEENLLSHLEENWWRETILFYAAQANSANFNRLIQVLCRLARQADNNLETTIAIAALAYDCQQESTNAVAVTLKNELRSLRYKALETYLREGQRLADAQQEEEERLSNALRRGIRSAQKRQAKRNTELLRIKQRDCWKKAEEETYGRMIQVVGKEEGPWFSSEDLREFDAEELLYIDRLWVEYSRGKFGFSVQKRIYQECGGKTIGEHDPVAWKKFGRGVGWFTWNRGWISFNELTFDLNAARPGHLPLYPRKDWASELAQGGAIFSNPAWNARED